MLSGTVTSNKEAAIRVWLSGPNGQPETVDAIIDTGFNGFLTLPKQLITSLMLPFVGTTRAALGDGKDVPMDVFEATVRWDEQERNVLILAAEGVVLVGMSMLSGYRVTIDVEEGGLVRIEALS